MKTYALIGYAIINIVSFLVCFADKQRAKHRGWRVPERVLWILSFCFGALGMYIGMRINRHKTQKPAFMFGVPLIFAAQIFLMIWLGVFD